MEKLKKWISEHKNETIGFGVFLALFIVLTGGVAYYSFAEPPKDTKAATGQETSVAVKGQNEKAENEEQDKDKKETDTNKEKASETAKKDTAAKEKEEKNSDRKREEEKKEEQEKKQETAQKTEDNKAAETAVAPAASTETEQPADTGSSAPAATAQPESGNTQAAQPEPEPVQELPVETPAQETPAQETPAQPVQEQPAEPEPEPQPVWHEAVYEQQWVVDQAAWDETVSEPIYEEVSRAICNGCGADITDCIDEHGYNAMMSGNMSCGAYHVVTETIQTGTNTYTIHHDEIGHYENVLVQEGYWE